MTQPGRFLLRWTALVVGSWLFAAGCGSSDSTSDSATDTAAPAEGGSAGNTAEPEPAVTTLTTDAAPGATAPPEATAAPEATTAPVEAGGSSDEVQLTLDDGRTWTFVKTTCTFDADATGPAAAVIIIDGFNDDGAELGVIEAWPLDGSTDTGTAFIGTFTAEDDELFIFEKSSAAMAGDLVDVTGTYYTDVFYQEGDEPDGTYALRCEP